MKTTTTTTQDSTKATTRKDAHPAPLAVRPEEAAALIGVSRASLYRLLAAGEIPSRRAGRARLVAVRHLEDWLDRQAS